MIAWRLRRSSRARRRRPQRRLQQEAIRRETRKALERVAPESGVTEWPAEDLATTAERLGELSE
jgi:hypothetical protein